MQSIHAQISARLAALNPVSVDLLDDSASHAGHAGAQQHAEKTGAHAGTHFELTIVSPMFAGKSLVARHRMVYALLDDLMQLSRLARVLFLPSREEIDLRSAGF